MIFIDKRFIFNVVDNDIQVTVIVQVSVGSTVGKGRQVVDDCFLQKLELQIFFVAEKPVWQLYPGHFFHNRQI